MRWSVPPAALKDDRAFVLAAVAQSGHPLQFASAPRSRPTGDVVLATVAHTYGRTLQHASAPRSRPTPRRRRPRRRSRMTGR